MDPEGGATFEFGQVAGAAFDLADAAGADAEGVADLLLGDAVCDAQFTESSSAFGGRFADGHCSCADGDEGPVGLAGDEAFQAADDLHLAFAFLGLPVHVVAGGLVVAHADDGDVVQGGVALPVAAFVEPVPVGLAAGGGDGADTAELGKRGLAADAFGVVPGDEARVTAVTVLAQ